MTAPHRQARMTLRSWRRALRRFASAMLALGLLGILAGAASAHVTSGQFFRVVHLAETADGLVAYIRISFPLVVAGQLGGGDPAAPYTTDRLADDGTVMHFIDIDAVRRGIMDLGQRIASTQRIGADGSSPVPGEAVAARVSLRGAVLPFNTLEEAQLAVQGPAFPDYDGAVEISSAILDVAVHYPISGVPERLTFVSTLDPGTIADNEVINLLVVHAADGMERSQQRDGLLAAPVLLYEAPLHAALRFVALGAEHILSGLDHLFFVMCLVIGAATMRGLAWRVTGFTIGHSVTLAAGFLGYAPAGDWFAPAVEIGIAASIIYAASAALGKWGGGGSTALVTAALGLLHGFGFSAPLRALVPPDDPDMLLRLAAFNGGVEVGQLLVICVLWPPLAWLRRRSPERGQRMVEIVGIGAVWVAATWIIQRVPPLIATL